MKRPTPYQGQEVDAETLRAFLPSIAGRLEAGNSGGDRP